MKKLFLAILFLATMAKGQTFTGTIIQTNPLYATVVQFDYLQQEINDIESTNGLTLETALGYFVELTNSVYTGTVAKAASALQDGQTNVTIQVIENTNALSPATYAQLVSAISLLQTQIHNISFQDFQQYLSTNMVSLAGFIPTNQYVACDTQITNALSFTYTYTATNTYGYMSVCTNHIFTNLVAGTATFTDFNWENVSGTITEKIECYAFNINTTNSVEIGQDAIPQAVPTSDGTYRIFTIPYSAHTNAGGFYLGFKKKCIAKGVGSDVIQLLGNGYNTHIDWGFSKIQ